RVGGVHLGIVAGIAARRIEVHRHTDSTTVCAECCLIIRPSAFQVQLVARQRPSDGTRLISEVHHRSDERHAGDVDATSVFANLGITRHNVSVGGIVYSTHDIVVYVIEVVPQLLRAGDGDVRGVHLLV